MDFTKERFYLNDFVYGGREEFGSGLFVMAVCENIEYLESVANELSKEIESIADMYDYLWCLSLKRMIKDLPSCKIDEGLKTRIKNFANSIKINELSFIKYTNDNYQEIFNKENHDREKWPAFFYYVLDLCYGTYSQGINSEVFRYLEDKYPLQILSHFSSCSKYYSNHVENFKTLFRDVKNTRPFDDQIYLKFLLNMPNKDDIFIREQAIFICERAINEVKVMNLTEDNQEIVQVQTLIQEYGKLAILFKLTCANEYKELKKDIQEKLDKFIMKHGVKHHVGPINLKSAVEILRNKDDPYKFIQLTHKMNKNGDIVNSLEHIFDVNNKNNPLSELFNDISRNRSNKYPYYKQDSMKANLWIRTNIVNLILGDEMLLGEFANYIYNVSLQIQDHYFDNTINIENEITGQVDCLAAIMELSKQNQSDTPYVKAITHNVSMSFCATIEKILRNVALKEVKHERYFDTSKATLADFFNKQFKLDDISNGLKYYLEFYLIKEVNHGFSNMDKPGLNIRNNLMHGEDNSYESTDYGVCLNLFYFLISLLGDLFITLPKNEDENL